MAGGKSGGIWGACIAVAAICGAAAQAVACPFCPLNLTLTERIDQAHCAYAVEWVSGRPGNPDLRETGKTDLRITHVFKNGEPLRKVGDIVTLPDYSEGQRGEKSLLFGQIREEERLGWDGLVPVTDEVIEYVVKRPAFEIKAPERLHYFLPFLEHPNETIAVDAYSEFGNAPYDAVKAIAPQLPREEMAHWITETDPSTGRIARIGFYGFALGLCGGEAEAAALERVIHAPVADDFRLGIDGIMAGYLFLRGPAGLDVLKQHAHAEGVPASEIYAMVQAVKFHWEFGNGNLSKDDMRACLRDVVENPQFAELVIVDLTRWQDLSLVDRLVELYGREDFSNLPTQTAIARYYLATAELDPAGRTAADREAIERAKLHLEELRQRDGELVQRAARLFRAPDPVVAKAADVPAATPPATPTLAVCGGTSEPEPGANGGGEEPLGSVHYVILSAAAVAALVLAWQWLARPAAPRAT
jgi:hypothetical protein